MEDGSKHSKEGRIPNPPRWAQDLGEAFRHFAMVRDNYALQLGDVVHLGEMKTHEEEQRWSNFSNCITALRDVLPNELYIGEIKPTAPIKLNFGHGNAYYAGYSTVDTISYFLPKDGKVLSIDRRVKVDPSYIPGTPEYQGISKIIFPTKKGLPYGVSVTRRRLSVSEQAEAFKGMEEQVKDADKKEILRRQMEEDHKISQKFAEEREREEEFFAQQKKMRILNILKIFKQYPQVADKLPNLLSFNLGERRSGGVPDMKVVLDTVNEDIFRAPMIKEEKKTFLGRKKIIERLDLEKKEPSQIQDWHVVTVDVLRYLLPHGDGRKYVEDMYYGHE